MKHFGRFPVLLASCALVLAACGQKGGVHQALTAGRGGGGSGALASPGAGGASDNGVTAGSPGDTSVGGTAAGGGTGGGAPGVSGGGGGASSSGGGGSAGAGGGAVAGASGGGASAVPNRAAAANSPAASGPGDSEGVTADEIRIGIHAPVTGAAPFPVASFQQGAHLYFENFLNARGGINGRKVKVFFEDDGYNPSQAVAKCKKMKEEDHVFLLVGGGGADQITACAQYAASVGVPYLSEGVDENALAGNASFFALSQTYAQQGVILAQYIKNVLHKTKVAMIRADTDNFQDAHAAFVKAAHEQGLDCGPGDKNCNLTLPKDASTSEDAAAASQLKSTGADVVYPLMAPVLFLNLAGQAHSQLYNPRYAGVGVTLALNTVATVACPTGEVQGGASFFSPTPGLDQADALDPDYNKAYQATYGQKGDDIGLLLWGAEKEIGAELAAAGKNLTRQSFVAAINGKHFHTGLYPDVDYAKSHFGGTGVQVQIINCAKQQYDTQFTFKSSF
ncbi:MAG: ABC transporter substrate-binding protein [Acidimicrobiales bacterium]